MHTCEPAQEVFMLVTEHVTEGRKRWKMKRSFQRLPQFCETYMWLSNFRVMMFWLCLSEPRCDKIFGIDKCDCVTMISSLKWGKFTHGCGLQSQFVYWVNRCLFHTAQLELFTCLPAGPVTCFLVAHTRTPTGLQRHAVFAWVCFDYHMREWVNFLF